MTSVYLTLRAAVSLLGSGGERLARSDARGHAIDSCTTPRSCGILPSSHAGCTGRDSLEPQIAASRTKPGAPEHRCDTTLAPGSAFPDGIRTVVKQLLD